MFLFMHHGKCWWCRNHHIGFDIRLQEETQSSAPGEISDTDSSLHSSVGSISTRDQPRGFQEDFQEQNKLPAQFLLLNLLKLSGWKEGSPVPRNPAKQNQTKQKNPSCFSISYGVSISEIYGWVSRLDNTTQSIGFHWTRGSFFDDADPLRSVWAHPLLVWRTNSDGTRYRRSVFCGQLNDILKSISHFIITWKWKVSLK